ncbi:MAG: sigma-54 dependent transcriptional regulator [Deltaproteobacteria bacterium]|nr:sigma-54 dependent transcriptional regulator [Deltaproteobacteria bacterium]
MRASLIISSSKEIVNLISTSLPKDYRLDTLDSLNEALSLFQKNAFDVIFIDLIVLKDASNNHNYKEAFQALRKIHPLVDIVVLASKENIRETVKAIKAGADDYLTYPIDPAEVQLIVESLHESLTQNLELDYLRDKFWKTEWLDIIRTRSLGMREAYNKIRAVAPTKATALMTGETGTGKGLIARVIHRHSNRSEDPFISVHCGAIPDTLLESELFGHEKGAFTGAVRKKPGKFELACSGTIFLDEIGTISPSAQIKLLQVLQDGTFSRVGGEEVLTTDARVIAATNADLAGMSDRGEFRRDLFYRLNVFPVEIPPLRERVEDISFLIEVFLNKLNQKYGKNIQTVPPQVINALKNYHWPGNIRELENLMERAFILEAGAMLTPESFPAELFKSGAEFAAILPVDAQLPLSEARRQVIEDFERQYLKELFSRNKGKVGRVAEEAGVSTRQLNKLMVKYGIRKEAFKD